MAPRRGSFLRPCRSRDRPLLPAPGRKRRRRSQRRGFWAWPAQDCALITQIEDHPAAKVLQVLWVCGRLPENWRAILAALERWGEQQGCTEVETGGRFGWERQLAEEGYSAVPWVTLRKEI